MFFNMSKSTLKCMGLITVLLYLALGIAAIIMAGINYQVINVKWAEGPWKHLAPIQLAVTIYLTVTSLIGLSVFTCCSNAKIVISIYVVINLLSLLFSWSIGIFASIGGTIYHRKNGLLGCDTELTGVLQMWKNVDEYFIYANSVFCSPLCPCDIDGTIQTKFKRNKWTNPTFSNTIGHYASSSNTEKVTRFQDCPEAAKLEVDRLYKSNPNNTAHAIDQEKFAKYWKGIEKRFNCTGWCKTSFTNPFTEQKQKMLNFVFSDVNKGVPKYPGCLNRLVNWLPRLILAVGCCLIFAAFIQTLNMLFAIGLMSKPMEEDNEFANKNIEGEAKQLNPKKEEKI